MVFTIGFFILAILTLVLIHEFGHFIVARLCGVKVLRFSFGFGKILARYQGKSGTEYVWSLLPLGGYVKFLDEAEKPVAASERKLAFNNKPLLARIAIIIAGPLFNFVFAIFAFWLILVIGITSLAPVISKVEPGSIAAQLGLQPQDELLEISGKKIYNWHDFQFAILPYIGSHEEIPIKIKSQNGEIKVLRFPLELWTLDQKSLDIFANLGIAPFIPKIPPIVGEVMSNTPAADAGFKAGDIILQVADKNIEDWLEFLSYVKQHPALKVSIKVKRLGQVDKLSVIIGSSNKEGFLGLRSQKIDWPKKWLRIQKQGALEAFSTSTIQTVDLTISTFKFLGRFVTGALALHNISGPLGIAEGAGISARAGFTSYLSFLAIISISLGALNLLPIPMLDGGYLLYYLIESITRRPLSDKTKNLGSFIGLMFLISIMILAFSNDLTRLLGT